MLARFQNHNNVSTARCETRCGRAWPQCWWAAAGPGRASRRRAERSSRRGRRAGGPPPTGTHSGLNEHQQHCKRRRYGGSGGPGRNAGGRRQGLAGLRDDAPSRRLAARTASGRAAAQQHTQRPERASAALQAPPVWRGRRAWPQCWWAAAGPGRASRRRAEPKARGADGERAGRRPPAHTAAQPRGRTRRCPEQQRRHKQHSTGARTRRPAPLDATTQTQLRSTCVRCRSAHAAHRSRRSSRSPRLRRRAGPLR